MSSLLGLPLPCGWETKYNDLKPTPLGANEHPRGNRFGLVGDLRVGSIGTGPLRRKTLVGKEGQCFLEPVFLETSRYEQHGARRSPVGSRREPPLVRQGEMLQRHRRDSPMAE